MDCDKKGTTSLSQRRVLYVLRHPGSILAFMHDPSSPSGKSYFVLGVAPVKSGRVAMEIAESLIKRPDMMACNDSLLPGCSQTYQLARNFVRLG